jgi:hypothetical protein
MAFGPAKSGGLSYDPSHSRAKVRSAVLIVGDLGEQCGASDRVRRDFQYLLKIQMHGQPLRRC